MAERYDLIIDFSRYSIGTQVVLQNLGLPNNDNTGNTNKIMRFDVVRSESDNSSIPSTLRNIQFIPESSAVRTRDFTFEQSNRLWVINGNGWDETQLMPIHNWKKWKFGDCTTTQVCGFILFTFTLSMLKCLTGMVSRLLPMSVA
jgi:hypothetical protein